MYAATTAAKLLQSCLTLCDPIDWSPPGSPIPGILQARTLEWVAISFSNAWKWKVKSESEFAQSCPTLSDPMDCSLPGSSVHGIFQARVLEWGAIAFSNEKTWRNLNCVLLGGRNQSEKAIYCMSPTMWHFGKGKATRTELEYLFWKHPKGPFLFTSASLSPK